MATAMMMAKVPFDEEDEVQVGDQVGFGEAEAEAA